VEPENTEVAPKFNGITTNQEETIKPDESQTTVLYHPPKGTIEDVTGWPKWYSKTQPRVTGTSSQPPPLKKEKKQVLRSPRKKPVASLILPYIPYWVRVELGLLGQIDKLK
jgi:hypothetical protein